jgi:DNA-binding transcriptional LysR family regulator
MTFEQLAIFVAVAEREHLTHAAEAIHLTPSAVSSAIKNLEAYYGVELFHRVGRRIELTETGRSFLGEAKATLARVRSAELMLSELGGLQRGQLSLYASQTIASYWLPPLLMRFHRDYPGIELDLTIGNTRTVTEAVINGAAELGFIEGEVDAPALSMTIVAQDALVIVVPPHHPWADGRQLAAADLASDTSWVMREEGSGTRTRPCYQPLARDKARPLFPARRPGPISGRVCWFRPASICPSAASDCCVIRSATPARRR